MLIRQLTLDALASRMVWMLALPAQNQLVLTAQRISEIRLMRGLLALERGDTTQAADHFQRALDTRIAFSDRPIAQRYLQLLRGN
jgi:Tfp pilus assembly protein PilF